MDTAIDQHIDRLEADAARYRANILELRKRLAVAALDDDETVEGLATILSVLRENETRLYLTKEHAFDARRKREMCARWEAIVA